MYVHTYNISDDISLLCPTISGLNKMVEIAEQYAAEYSIIFNASKSKLLCFNESGCNRSSKCVTVNGDRIRPSDSDSSWPLCLSLVVFVVYVVRTQS